MIQPDMTGRYTREQMEVMYRGRPVPTPIPRVGETVAYRHDSEGELVPARVLDVAMSDRADPNVWHAGGGGLVRDPAPLLLLVYQRQVGKGTVAQEVMCREARVPGQPGWTWPATAGGE